MHERSLFCTATMQGILLSDNGFVEGLYVIYKIKDESFVAHKPSRVALELEQAAYDS